MQDMKFWRIVAVVVCAGLFYVGHGLYDHGSDGLPSLANVAHAGGVGVAQGGNQVFTASADVKTLYFWMRDGVRMQYVGMATADKLAPKQGTTIQITPPDGGHAPFWYDARDPEKPTSAPPAK
jgi:hypothetical protein